MYFSARALLTVAAGFIAVGSVTAAPAEQHEQHEPEARPPRITAPPGNPGRPGYPGFPGFPGNPGRPNPYHSPSGYGASSINSLSIIGPISSVQPIGTLSTRLSSPIPESCWTTWDDFQHNTGGVSVNCFTYTSTTAPASSKCPICTGPFLPCPFIILETTSNVPCATDCCPTTATKYVDGPCPECGVCNIPTETQIITTGCPTPTGSNSVTIHPVPVTVTFAPPPALTTVSFESTPIVCGNKRCANPFATDV